MPAFFIISGYCSNFKKSAKAFFISQFKSLIIPLVSLWFISTILSALFQGKNIIEELGGVFANGMGLWFLQALFLGKLIVFFIEIISKKMPPPRKSHLVLLLTFCLMVIGFILDKYNKTAINIFYYRHAFIASFWISVGTYLKKNPVIYEKSMRFCLFIYPVLAVLSLFLFIHPSFTAKICITIKTLPFFLLYSYVGTMFLFSLCKYIKKNETIEYWGRNSLVVYGMHFPLYLYTAKILYVIIIPINIGAFLLYITILFLIEYLYCWIMVKLFERYPFSVFLGKW